MTAEAGHAPNRFYVDRDGNVHLNGGSIFDASEVDLTSALSKTVDLVTADLTKLAAVESTAQEITDQTDLSVNGALLKVKKLAITADFDNTEQDTLWTLPAKAVVLDVFLDVTTADASQTLDVGTDGSGSNDPDGFLDAASVNATGVIRGEVKSTAGGNNTYIGAASTHTLGALLMDLLAGEDVTAGGDGNAAKSADPTSGGESITYTGSDATNTLRGAIYVVYLEIS